MRKRRDKHSFSTNNFKSKYLVLVIAFITILLSAAIGGVTKAQEERETRKRIEDFYKIENMSLAEAYFKVQEENAYLRPKVEAVTKVPSKASKLTEGQVREIVKILFPEKDQDNFMKILKCENGTHQVDRVNHNREGLGYDLGLAQINSKFHSQRVERMFLEDFDKAMVDPFKNLLYAAYLYRHSGLSPWVCSKIIAEAN